MNYFYKKSTILSILIAVLASGCASESSRTVHKITIDDGSVYSKQNTQVCSDALKKSTNEDRFFNSRIIATPIIGVLGIIAAPALLAMNASLDIKDRNTASKINQACGGKNIGALKIAQDVAINSSIGFVLQGSNLSVYPGGEQVSVSAAAEASSR